jgi:hypothetical protein
MVSTSTAPRVRQNTTGTATTKTLIRPTSHISARYPNVKNIRYFFMLGISNELTNQIIASCLQRAKKELSEWPGTSFSTDTDEGHALLGM